MAYCEFVHEEDAKRAVASPFKMGEKQLNVVERRQPPARPVTKEEGEPKEDTRSGRGRGTRGGRQTRMASETKEEGAKKEDVKEPVTTKEAPKEQPKKAPEEAPKEQ